MSSSSVVTFERHGIVAVGYHVRREVTGQSQSLWVCSSSLIDGDVSTACISYQNEQCLPRSTADIAIVETQMGSLRKAIADAWSGHSIADEMVASLRAEVPDLRSSAATSAELGSVEVSMDTVAGNYCTAAAG